jgi:NAD(P)H-hydrate epimerase
MQTLPVELFTAAQVRAMDQTAIQVHGIDGYTLMNRAGAAAMAALRSHFPKAQRLLVVCGAGNNAGDGYVIARLARNAGLTVAVSALIPVERLGGDAARAWSDFAAAGGVVSAFSPSLVEQADVVVDALLGTGLDREVGGVFKQAIDQINAHAAGVLAVDIPSGLDADSGAVRGSAIRSDVTVTFVALKQGLFVGLGRDHWRHLEFSDLDIPPEIAAQHRPALKCLDQNRLRQILPPRARDSHKGTHGSLLLVGGGPGMPGAIRLAAEAALRCGAGLVRVATWPDNLTAVVAGRPEIICHGVTQPGQLDDLLADSDAVVMGPGLGTTAWAQALWQRVLASDLPVVLDADGLNLLAAAPERRGHWVLTPHPGEAARLLGLDIRSVQLDRPATAVALAERYDGVAVLKGSGSLVAAPGAVTALSLAGNPGMASAGMGDVLAGVIGGLRCQINDLGEAARIGVLIHALAGDSAAAQGERGMLASDLLPGLRRWVNPS